MADTACTRRDDRTAAHLTGDFPDSVTTATAEEFVAGVAEFTAANPAMGALLTIHDPADLADHTLLTTTDGNAGVAVSPDGDIQNLYNHDGPDGAGRTLLRAAIAAGGRILDCYDGFLRELYADHGFRETGRMEFDPDHAPEGWDADRSGHPDVVFMSYQPNSPDDGETDTYYTPDEWTNAKADSATVAAD